MKTRQTITSVRSNLAKGRIAATHPPLQSFGFTYTTCHPRGGECSRLDRRTMGNTLIRRYNTLQRVGKSPKSAPSRREDFSSPHKSASKQQLDQFRRFCSARPSYAQYTDTDHARCDKRPHLGATCGRCCPEIRHVVTCKRASTADKRIFFRV